MDSLFHPIKYLDHNHYTDAVSCAIKSLTSIYQKLSDKTLYRKEYLVKVTKAIECGLLSNCLKVTECTIQSIHGLFNERAFEFNILLPSLLCAVTNCSTQSGTVERLSAIQLIHEFMPIIGKGRSSNIIPTLQKDTSISYEDVWSKLLYLTLQSFKNERNSDILKELIKIISKFIIDGAFSGGENVDTIFISISNLFVDNEYQLETLLGQSHEDLVDFLEIILSHSAICKDSPKSILSVFDFLLKFITKNVDNKQTRNLNSLYNVFSGYFIKCFDQLSLERLKMSCNVLNQVFSMLDSSRTEDSSSFFDFKLMNAIKQFALPITPLQTPIDEICLVNEFSQHTKYNYEEYIHIFQKGKSIFTFIELPWLQVNEEKSVILIIRNPYGKQCYHSKLRQNEMEWTLHEVTEEFEPFIKDVLPQHQVVWDSKSEFDISSVVNKLDKTLTECKRSSASLTKPTIINYQSLEKQQTISPSITCRMLINCLSYTDISNTLRVLPNTKQFLQSLQLLDSIPTKHIISVDIINQTKPTTEFVSFLDTLGTVIQTNDKEQKLAFDESFFRIEFNSPLLKTTEKKMSSQVQLYWNEPLQQTDEFNISIIPTVSDLFVVSTNCPSSTLEQTQLVHLSTLGPLIREAIISYSRRTTEPLKPLKNRQNVIEELVTKRNACLPFVDTAFSNATIESLNNIGFKQLEVFSKTTTTTSDQVGQSDGNSTHPDGLGQTKPSGKIIRTSQIITQTKLNGEEEGESVVTATPTKMSDSSNLQSPNSEKKKKLGFFRRSTSKK
ncbi:Rap-GAP domain-containing protein [Entamoeba marina]